MVFRTRIRAVVRTGIDTDGISLEVQSVIASMEQLELYIDAVVRFGKQCANPGSFMGALLAIGTSRARMADGVEYGYVEAGRDVLKSGGCNCCRANFVGACLGAAYGCYDDSDPVTAEESRRGSKGIPRSWLLRTTDIVDIMALSIKLFS